MESTQNDLVCSVHCLIDVIIFLCLIVLSFKFSFLSQFTSKGRKIKVSVEIVESSFSFLKMLCRETQVPVV